MAAWIAVLVASNKFLQDVQCFLNGFCSLVWQLPSANRSSFRGCGLARFVPPVVTCRTPRAGFGGVVGEDGDGVELGLGEDGLTHERTTTSWNALMWLHKPRASQGQNQRSASRFHSTS